MNLNLDIEDLEKILKIIEIVGDKIEANELKRKIKESLSICIWQDKLKKSQEGSNG